MKKLRLSVLATRNGSTNAVLGSGNSAMSDSLIAWNPRIEEPSKARPLSKTSCPKDDTGTVKCCSIPGRSTKRTSTNSTPSSLTYLSSSSLFWNMQFSLGSAEVLRNVCTASFSTVSRLFRPCNRCSADVCGCLRCGGFETLAAQAPQPPVVEEGALRPSRNLATGGWDR